MKTETKKSAHKPSQTPPPQTEPKTIFDVHPKSMIFGLNFRGVSEEIELRKILFAEPPAPHTMGDIQVGDLIDPDMQDLFCVMSHLKKTVAQKQRASTEEMLKSLAHLDNKEEFGKRADEIEKELGRIEKLDYLQTAVHHSFWNALRLKFPALLGKCTITVSKGWVVSYRKQPEGDHGVIDLLIPPGHPLHGILTAARAVRAASGR